MRYIIGLFLSLFFIQYAYADRICIEKNTGKLIEYQSGDAPLGTLTKNALSAGYKLENIEEKYITYEDWLKIRDKQIIKPAKERDKQKNENKKLKEEKIREKLKLSKEDFNDLKEAIND